MYIILKTIGFWIRQFFLPNPFDLICPDKAAVLNIIFGLILVPISYAIVELLYNRHENEAIYGTIMFNGVYMFISLVLWGLLALYNIIIENNLIFLIGGLLILFIIATISIIIYNKKKCKN